VRIEFRDNGCGIPPEHLERVFEEHFTTKGAGHGSGLGLALCRSLIREAGGEISIASAPGAGTIVTVRLPVTTMGSEDASARERG
jgi:two-component system NtrC family sensor kinase